jgi:hypothetical protein
MRHLKDATTGPLPCIHCGEPVEHVAGRDRCSNSTWLDGHLTSCDVLSDAPGSGCTCRRWQRLYKGVKNV